MRAELAVRADEPGRRVDDHLVVMGDLGLEPGPVALDQTGRTRGAQGGEEERQRVDAVLVDIARAVEVVDGRRDVATPAGPDVERVRQRVVDAGGVAEPDQRWRTEGQVARPEHVEVARAGGEGPAVPARFDAGPDDRGRAAGMALVAAELAPQADPGVVDVLGKDSRCDPGGEGHARLRALLRDGFPMRPGCVAGPKLRLSPSRNLFDPSMVRPFRRNQVRVTGCHGRHDPPIGLDRSDWASINTSNGEPSESTRVPDGSRRK